MFKFLLGLVVLFALVFVSNVIILFYQFYSYVLFDVTHETNKVLANLGIGALSLVVITVLSIPLVNDDGFQEGIGGRG